MRRPEAGRGARAGRGRERLGVGRVARCGRSCGRWRSPARSTSPIPSSCRAPAAGAVRDRAAVAAPAPPAGRRRRPGGYRLELAPVGRDRRRAGRPRGRPSRGEPTPCARSPAAAPRCLFELAGAPGVVSEGVDGRPQRPLRADGDARRPPQPLPVATMVTRGIQMRGSMSGAIGDYHTAMSARSTATATAKLRPGPHAGRAVRPRAARRRDGGDAADGADQAGDPPGARPMTVARAYEGLRVVDLTAMIAGPMATMVLADLGADVIKIERPHGDDGRFLPPFHDGVATLFQAFNRNKRGRSRSHLGPRAGRRAAPRRPRRRVWSSRSAPASSTGSGCRGRHCAKRNPRLVYCSVNAYGDRPARPRPARLRPGRAGLLRDHGGQRRPRRRAGARAAVADRHHDRDVGGDGDPGRAGATRGDGRGERVETALVDSGFFLMCHQLLSMLATGEPHARTGARPRSRPRTRPSRPPTGR